MNIRTQAAADLQQILQDVDGGFAVEFTVKSPLGVTAQINGFYRSIGYDLDPQTGQMIESDTASAALPESALIAAGLSEIHSIADGTYAPWLIEITEANGSQRTLKVRSTARDELGCIVCQLEAFKKI